MAVLGSGAGPDIFSGLAEAGNCARSELAGGDFSQATAAGPDGGMDITGGLFWAVAFGAAGGGPADPSWRLVLLPGGQLNSIFRLVTFRPPCSVPGGQTVSFDLQPSSVVSQMPPAAPRSRMIALMARFMRFSGSCSSSKSALGYIKMS